MPAQFRLRLYCDGTIAIGPGKVALLEAIDRTGSISAAARTLGMSYRRAWLLIDAMNRTLIGAVLDTSNNGAILTDVGRRVVQHYRSIEAAAYSAAAAEIATLDALITRAKRAPD